MVENNFFEKINKYYDNLKNDISKKIDIGKDYSFERYEENKNQLVNIFLDEKLILKAEYNVIGMYNIPLSIWYWGWNIAFLNKDLIKDLQMVSDFLNLLDKNYQDFDAKEADLLYYFLSNPNFYITNDKIDEIIKLVLYLTKTIWFFPIKYINKNNNISIDQLDKIEYIVIRRILQYY